MLSVFHLLCAALALAVMASVMSPVGVVAKPGKGASGGASYPFRFTGIPISHYTRKDIGVGSMNMKRNFSLIGHWLDRVSVTYLFTYVYLQRPASHV